MRNDQHYLWYQRINAGASAVVWKTLPSRNPLKRSLYASPSMETDMRQAA